MNGLWKEGKGRRDKRREGEKKEFCDVKVFEGSQNH
jgi:hypothetical protein